MSLPPYAHPGPVAGLPAPRRCWRDLDAPVAGGVAGGLARYLGVPVLWVRVFFVVTALLGGAGIMLYAGLWVFLPGHRTPEREAPGLESARRGGRRPGRAGRIRDAGPAIAVGAVVFGIVLGFEGLLGRGALFWPVVVGVAGVALLWRQADEAQRERWLDSSGRIDPFRAVIGDGGWAAWTRIVAGLGLILAALIGFAVTTGVANAVPVVVAGLLGIAGLALVVGPWVLRLVDDLASERAERVRTQERADMAAHLHDSVLQTLALIQKSAGDPTTVARLARSQERDLRQWLFSSETSDATTLAGRLREIAAQVEVDHPVLVDVVTVGDCAAAEQVQPVVLAAREAVVNAAKHAGVDRVDVYAEVTEREIEVFVRDRGRGFDPDVVAGDRHGVRRSIIDRMERHGGSATIRSAPDSGTEVRLRMPLPVTEEKQQ